MSIQIVKSSLLTSHHRHLRSRFFSLTTALSLLQVTDIGYSVRSGVVGGCPPAFKASQRLLARRRRCGSWLGFGDPERRVLAWLQSLVASRFAVAPYVAGRQPARAGRLARGYWGGGGVRGRVYGWRLSGAVTSIYLGGRARTFSWSLR